MNRVLTITILIMINFLSFGQEKKFVCAFNGLIVRDQPSTKGKKINKLPYRTEVSILNATGKKFTLNENGYKIAGEWVQITNDSMQKPSYVFNGFLKSKAQVQAAYDDFVFDKENELFKQFHGVYEFNNEVTAIVIFDEKIIKNIDFEAYDIYGSKDALKKANVRGFENLFKNTMVTQNYNHYKDDTFYIYYEKGIQEVKITEVLFSANECTDSFVALTFNNIYFHLGKPILASKEKIALEFGNYKSMQAKRNFYSDVMMWDDCGFYGDSGHLKLYAKYKNMYFGYRNLKNFKTDINPFRQIFHFEKENLIIDYGHYIDLFGCPCL